MVKEDKQRGQRSREIRIALVLYGGVSLAVYENGVAESFFDLTKGSHVFGLLLRMLDARAIIDVIAGTSAGGINGPILAAALEHGADFKVMSRLWREIADFGALLRSPNRSNRAESLLDEDGYFFKSLLFGFKELMQNGAIQKPYLPAENEIDVYVTGTDFYGRIYSYLDELNNEIEDKDHRTVFHLKYRPGEEGGQPSTKVSPRERLGLSRAQRDDFGEDELDEIQANVLASVCRITASFPGAFPPYRVDFIEDEGIRTQVQDSLNLLCGMKASEVRKGHRKYVDGGVLDNKPFGPALKSIFYRMPLGLVDRKLFYVEPDPVVFTDKSRFGSSDEETPLNVLISSASGIPLHDSIKDDLDDLMAHNARVKWLNKIKEQAYEAAIQNKGIPDPKSAQIYLGARIESISKSILLKTDKPPTATDDVSLLGVYEEEIEEKKERMNSLPKQRGFLSLFELLIKEELLNDFQRRETNEERQDTAAAVDAVDKDSWLSHSRIEEHIREIDGALNQVFQIKIEKAYAGGVEKSGPETDAKEDFTELLTTLNRFDITYKLRKSFYFLYRLYDELEKGGENSYTEEELLRIKDLLLSTGQIIKLLKLIHSSLILLRDKLIVELLNSTKHRNDDNCYSPELAGKFIETFENFLRVSEDRKRWKTLDIDGIKIWHEDWHDAVKNKIPANFGSDSLTVLNKAIKRKLSEVAIGSLRDSGTPTILELIGELLTNLVLNSPIESGKSKHNKEHYKYFSYIDCVNFPHEYLSGIFEKDIIEFVRVSPKDAKIGLSKKESESKIAGETLGHFSGFFRRDWRSNDILWGRLDTICLIIQTFLTDDEIRRVMGKKDLVKRVDESLKSDNCLKSFFPHLPEKDKRIIDLRNSWDELTKNPDSSHHIKNFREYLILAAQHDVVCEDLPQVYEDMYYQDMVWELIEKRESDPSRLMRKPEDKTALEPNATGGVIAAEAKKMALSSLGNIDRSEWGEHFRNLKLGEQSAVGDDAAIPQGVLGEYLTNAWLVLMGMLRSSFDDQGRKRTIFDFKTFKMVAQHPFMFFNMLLRMSRRDKKLSLILTTALSAIAITVFILAFIFEAFLWDRPVTWLWYLIPLGILYFLYKFNFIRLFKDDGLLAKMYRCLHAK